MIVTQPIMCKTRARDIHAFQTRTILIAEVTESELEDEDLRFEQFLDSEFDGVDGGHEANTVLQSPEGIAEIRSRRERM